VLATLFIPRGATHAQDAGAALARAEAAYLASPTLTARFDQLIINPLIGAPEQSSGTLYLERPARFAMRFDEPAGDRIVADGEWLWAYTPSAAPGQVFRQPVPTTGAATPNLFAQFVERPLERYAVEWVRTDRLGDAAADVVRLVPLGDDAAFRRAELTIDPAGMLRKLSLIEATGQRREFTFTAIVPGAAIPRQEFVFRVPPGVKVVTPS
jgi:outer membrane lipoprotein carrier protein